VKHFIDTKYVVLKNNHLSDDISFTLEKHAQVDLETLVLPASVSMQLENVKQVEFDNSYINDVKLIKVNDVVGFFFP